MIEPELSALLRAKTRTLHTQAEQSGFLRAILLGKASRANYVLYLRCLQPVYQALEEQLERHSDTPGVRHIMLPALFRARAIEQDLNCLAGHSWSSSVPILPIGEIYANRISNAGANDGARLIGHAYTRYLGDLNGGQYLKQLLARTLGLKPEALSFYGFPDIADTKAFAETYRAALNMASLETNSSDAIIDEAIIAFRLNISLSEAVQPTADLLPERRRR